MRLRLPLAAGGTAAALGTLAVVATQLPSRPAPAPAAATPRPAPVLRTVTIHRTVHVIRHVHRKRPPAAAPPAPAPVGAPAVVPPVRAAVPAAAAPPRVRTRTSPAGHEGDDHEAAAGNDD